MNSDKIPKIIALIPARSGSKRITDKNIRFLKGHPLIAYTIASALKSHIFDRVIVSTDSSLYASIAEYYGAEVPFLRPAAFAGDKSPDIEWIEYTLNKLDEEAHGAECFCILRPTNPFRSSETIKRAWTEFLSDHKIHSLRAVELCAQHPGKMWVVSGSRIYPLIPLGSEQLPWHSQPYHALPNVYIQNASIEIAWIKVVFETRTIAGTVIKPFFTDGYEGFDLNYDYDWRIAEDLLLNNKVRLTNIKQEPFQLKNNL